MTYKVGPCIDCPEESPEKPLIAGRCNKHYWRHRAKVKAAKPAAKEKVAHKQTLSAWFALQIQLCMTSGAKCENCGKLIGEVTRTNIAHIVPKSIFKEVATHPLNRWFACWQCHTNFDQWPEEKVAEMPIIATAKKRYQQFSAQILSINKRRVPGYLLGEG